MNSFAKFFTLNLNQSTDKYMMQEPAILAFSIPISILRLFLCLVDFDTETDTRKSENFDSDSDTDTNVKQVLLHTAAHTEVVYSYKKIVNN